MIFPSGARRIDGLLRMGVEVLVGLLAYHHFSCIRKVDNGWHQRTGVVLPQTNEMFLLRMNDGNKAIGCSQIDAHNPFSLCKLLVAILIPILAMMFT